MEIFTMNNRYAIQSEIDYFSTAIWTERLYGDADFQLTLPAVPSVIQALGIGTRVGCVGSDEVMMVEKQSIKKGVLTVVGTSLTQQLNCRFIRYTQYPGDKAVSANEGLPSGWNNSPGQLLANIVNDMAINGLLVSNEWMMLGSRAGGFGGHGIPIDGTRLKIPDFTIGGYDTTQTPTDAVIPYGPLFDGLKGLAEQYGLGQKVYRVGFGDVRYRNWLPVDRTSTVTRDPIRFSTELNNFGDTTEVIDGSKFKTDAYVYPDNLPNSQIAQTDPTGHVTGGAAYVVGYDNVEGDYTGFDLRADMVFASEVSSYFNDGLLQNMLDARAYSDLVQNRIVAAIDGTIQPGFTEFQYGRDYYLGDIVEAQGTSGIIQPSRVTEYIRAQDQSGERAYPTLVAVV